MSQSFTQSHSGGKKRILQIFCRYREYGGEEGSVYRIADTLGASYDVGTFLASSEDAFSDGLLSKGISVAKSFSNWTIVRQLRRYQAMARYDYWIIHNVFPVISPSVYTLAFELGVPVIQYLHNYRMGCVNGFFLNHGEPCQLCMHGNFLPALKTACWHGSHLQSGVMGAVIMRMRNMDLFHKVHRWVAISEAQKSEHVAMGIPADKITVIHHFLESVDPPMPYPEQGDVLFVGRLSREKGVDRLLLAWEKIQDCGRLLWIVGDGPERKGLEDMAIRLSLKNVKFTGFLEHAAMKEIWENAACSVVPSIWKEPFGMVVLESWAKGRPVVAHRLGALPELVDEGVNGVLVTPDRPEEMANALLAILKNSTKAEDMGRNGFAKLRANFTKEIWLSQFRDIL